MDQTLGGESHAQANTALAGRCRDVATTAVQALDWCRANAAISRDDLPTLERAFRQVTRGAERLARAAERPMCVSVFGPSQSGKSYLISALARREQAPLRVTLAGADVDFVEEINPPGGKESTGLVTRFSVRPDPGLPGLPVVLRLLSAPDVVRIVANGFLEDVRRDAVLAPSSDQMRQHAQDMRARAGAAVASVVGEDDVFELRAYFEQYFRSHPTITGLGSSFWLDAAALVPRLAPEDCARFFAPLWGQVPQLTELCARLLAALATLGNAAEACCARDALLPRENSIIDVALLHRFGDPSAGTVAIATRSGMRTELPRPVVAALVAELRLTLTAQPYDFFDHTDLLDFPGARSREDITDPAGFLSSPEKLGQLFLRGKVAYLFQRYVAEQELTAMLLCIGPGPQEVRTLPGIVKEWIDATHGRTPEDRARVDCGLFLVLTKFDMEFEEKRGSDPAWATRLENSLYKFLCLEYGWHETWSPGVPFHNTFWYRNPNFIAKALMDYGPDNRERGVREPDRIAKLKQSYLSTGEIQRHFADPSRAWDEGFRLNDGGGAYLAETLRPVCNPEMKRRQVAERLRRLAEELQRRLEPYHVSDDQEAERAKRMEEARGAVRQVQLVAREQRLGVLLRQLQVMPGSLQSLLYQVQAKAPLGELVSGRLVDAALAQWGVGGAGAAADTDLDRPANRPELFAHAALEEWTQRVHTFVGRPDLEASYHLSRSDGAVLAKVLTDGARRLRLRARLAAGINRHYVTVGDPWDRVRMPTLLAEEMINDFVTNLGFGAIPEAERPRVRHSDGIERPIFATRATSNALPNIGEEPVAYETDYLIDWCYGFLQLANDNAAAGQASGFDAAANQLLGRMIAALRQV